MTTGTDLITAERERQIEHLGYTQEHDAQHDDSDLAFAAACYASPATIFLLRVDEDRSREGGAQAQGQVRWVEPWPNGWPRSEQVRPISGEDRIRELTKAGALIAAEIDRILSLEDSA